MDTNKSEKSCASHTSLEDSWPAGKHVISDISSYPHPCFPSPKPPTVAGVATAKKTLVELICQSKPYLEAMRRIETGPSGSYEYVLLRENKTSTSMIGESVSRYSLITHEPSWPELLEKVYQTVGNCGIGNICIEQEQECVSVKLMWN